MSKKIYFYSRSAKYFEFSNFSEHPIEINGETWKTNEHYFQAVKFLSKEWRDKIKNSPYPSTAKKLGSSRDYKIHVDWDTRRIDVMLEAVRAKFSQHEDLRQLLLSTDDAELIEDSPSDYFWGCGKNKNGKNMLGQILMQVREELRTGSI